MSRQSSARCSGSGVSSRAPPARSHDELLKQVEQRARRREQAFQERRAEYDGTATQQRRTHCCSAPSNSATQLDAASKRLVGHVRRERAADQQPEHASCATKRRRSGLAEVFGLARQDANDTSSILQQSLITTQFPPAAGELPRDEWLRQFSAARATPTAAELERLWLEIQREMTASGQVAKYQHDASCSRAARPSESEVIRIGPFTATADGQFLAYLPNLRTLNVLPRQLPGEFMDIAERFTNATSGYAQAVVDSNRGVLLGLYVERPTIMERIEIGELIGYIIIVVGALGFLAFVFQLIQSGDRAHGREQPAQEPRSADAEQPARPRAARVQGRQEPRSRRTPTSRSCASRRPCCARCRSSSGSRRSCASASRPVRCSA